MKYEENLLELKFKKIVFEARPNFSPEQIFLFASFIICYRDFRSMIKKSLGLS